MDATQRGSNATVVRLNVARLDELAAAKGAKTNPTRAVLFGTDRATVVRWRHHKGLPTLAKAVEIARIFRVSVDDLIEAA